MNQGVTDVSTAKSIARKLFANYALSGQIQRHAMEKMMADTYRIMNKEFRPTSQDVGIYANLLDFNGDGKISVEDFQALAVKYLVKPDTRNYTQKIRQRLEVAKRLFLKFDTDRNGYLSKNQIPNLLTETYSMLGMNFEPTEEDIDGWMEMADLDRDGRVVLEDYERLVINSMEKCGIKIYERE